MSENVPLQVMGVLSTHSFIAAVGGVGVYRFDTEQRVQEMDKFCRATPANAIGGVGHGRLEWDVAKGAFRVGGLSAVS